MKRKERATAEAYKPPEFVGWFSSEQLLDCHFLVESYLRWLQLLWCRLLRLCSAAFYFVTNRLWPSAAAEYPAE